MIQLLHKKKISFSTCLVFVWIFLGSQNAITKPALSSLEKLDSGFFSDPFYLLFVLIGIALVPTLAIMMTSFAKIVVVLSIARQAIGTPQAPPNVVIISLAIMLTIFSMYPVGVKIFDQIDQNTLKKGKAIDAIEHVVIAAKEPMRNFLAANAQENDQELFFSLLNKNQNDLTKDVTKNDFIILAPAFLISQLSMAFQIGFLVYLPFLVIDMTVANLLMALGMQMLAPTTISLPFKILLFVLVDGWRLIAEGLAKV